MLKIKLITIYKYLLLGIIALTFLFSGFIQYFIGVSSTLYTLGLTAYAGLLIVFDILLRRKVIVNRFIFVYLFLIIIITVSAVINKSGLLKLLLYLNFALIPLFTSYLMKLNNVLKVDLKKTLSNVFLTTALIQLPIILIQKYGYNFLIGLSRANQKIASVDFMFGSFAVKADHALGFFLIMYMLSLIFKKRSGENPKWFYFLIAYISITILIMESNLTKLVLFGVISFYFYLWSYKKIGVLGIVVLFLMAVLGFNLMIKSSFIGNEIYQILNRFSPEDSYKAVTRGYEKRPQVVVYQLNYEPFKWIGNGPYDYYDIIKGEFKKTIHFSQIIWFYNDIGIIGLLVALMAALLIVKSLNLRRESMMVLLMIMLLYLFMSNLFGDISMMLSLMLLSNKEG
ncbi:hypothetical protein [Algibacter sp. Ld11]|uniref:hypothetical protein n=1 Tax=Algibacter sp. Ld11 TaxID=649150 RepID=UPI0038700300